MNQTVTIGLDEYRARLVNGLQSCGVPRHMWDSTVEYILQGRPVGDFLAALLSNDLMAAARKADLMNLPRLPDWAVFLDSCAPVACFGSAAAFKEWLRTGGLLGRQQAREIDNASPEKTENPEPR